MGRKHRKELSAVEALFLRGMVRRIVRWRLDLHPHLRVGPREIVADLDLVCEVAAEELRIERPWKGLSVRRRHQEVRAACEVMVNLAELSELRGDRGQLLGYLPTGYLEEKGDGCETTDKTDKNAAAAG